MADTRAKATHEFTIGVQSKNSMLIAATLEELHREGRSVPELDRACDIMLAYAHSHCPTADPVPFEATDDAALLAIG